MSKQKGFQLDELVKQQLALDFEEAREADAVCYFARITCQLALPMRFFPGAEYVRDSGENHLSILTPAKVGIPYGRYPRGILNWLVTSIVKRHEQDDGSRTVFLGKDLATFMESVSGCDLQTGGKNGNLTNFKRQMNSLFMSRIIYWTNDEEKAAWKTMDIAPNGYVFWQPAKEKQRGLFDSRIQIGEALGNDCICNKVAMDIRALRGLWNFGCLPMDLYAWLTYRAFVRLRIFQPTMTIPWPSLKFQFGWNVQDDYKFRQSFRTALDRVRMVYDGFTVDDWEGRGLKFRFTRTSVLPEDKKIFQISAPQGEATVLHLRGRKKPSDFGESE